MIKAKLVSLVLSTTAIIRQRKQQLQTLVLLLTLLPFIITTSTTDKEFWNKFSSTKKLNCLWLVWLKFCLACTISWLRSKVLSPMFSHKLSGKHISSISPFHLFFLGNSVKINFLMVLFLFSIVSFKF